MEEKLPIQYAMVEQPFGAEPPLVHCPICGKPTADLDEEGLGEFAPCEHTAFIYLTVVPDFAFMSEDFEKRTEDIDVDDYENFKGFLEATDYDNKLLAIEITYGGVGCGAEWYTDIYGFDYGTLKQSD